MSTSQSKQLKTRALKAFEQSQGFKKMKQEKIAIKGQKHMRNYQQTRNEEMKGEPNLKNFLQKRIKMQQACKQRIQENMGIGDSESHLNKFQKRIL